MSATMRFGPVVDTYTDDDGVAWVVVTLDDVDVPVRTLGGWEYEPSEPPVAPLIGWVLQDGRRRILIGVLGESTDTEPDTFVYPILGLWATEWDTVLIGLRITVDGFSSVYVGWEDCAPGIEAYITDIVTNANSVVWGEATCHMDGVTLKIDSVTTYGVIG